MLQADKSCPLSGRYRYCSSTCTLYKENPEIKNDGFCLFEKSLSKYLNEGTKKTLMEDSKKGE